MSNFMKKMTKIDISISSCLGEIPEKGYVVKSKTKKARL